MFWAFSAHHQELNDCSDNLWIYLRIAVIAVLCSCSGYPAGRPARPRAQHDCHHDTKVKPEAATAVIELPMMGGKTPETCWDVNKRQDNKLKNCCVWLVIYLNLINYLCQNYIKVAVSGSSICRAILHISSRGWYTPVSTCLLLWFRTS
jgi:hypothetical protein